MNAGPILLIEDNPGDVELTKRALDEADFVNELIVASSGREALDYMFGKDTRPGIGSPEIAFVLLDLKMSGGVSGIEVLCRIRGNESTRTLPVVILTSSSEKEDLAVCYDCGANAYIRKPVYFEEFAQAITATAAFWLNWNESSPARRGRYECNYSSIDS